MKEFIWKHCNKINFVDKNNLFVGINLKSPDELNGVPMFIQYGYWYSKNYKGKNLLNYDDFKDEHSLNQYYFDKSYISQSNDFPVIIDGKEYNCSQTIFKLNKDNDDHPIFLYIRCLSVDGYYSDGFDFAKFDNEETLEKYNNGELDLTSIRDYGKKVNGFDLYKSGEI